jgi:hypothetical protein
MRPTREANSLRLPHDRVLHQGVRLKAALRLAPLGPDPYTFMQLGAFCAGDDRWRRYAFAIVGDENGTGQSG